MKNLLFFLVVLLLNLLPQLAFATDSANSQEHNALRELKVNVENAINSNDIKLLSTFLAQDFTLITADQTVLTTEEELLNYWKERFSSPNSIVTSMKTSVTASILTIFTSTDSGYCYGTSKDIYTLRNGKRIEFNAVWSTQLLKENGQWKIKLAHAGVNFINNPLLEAKSMSLVKKLGVFLKISTLPGEVQE